MNQRRHRFTAFLLAVAMLSVLIFQSFAFFTDRETIQVSGTAGTVQIGLDTAKIKLMDEKGKDILNPGDKRDFSYTVKSLGNKSINVKETIVLSAFDSTNKPLDLSPTQSEFELYNSTDVELIAGAGWFPIATKEPIVIKTLSKNTIKYVRPEYVLSGGARYQDTEREIEYNNAVPIGTEATSNLVLLFKAASTNKWQKAILKFDIIVEAKQHRNTSAGWEAMIKDEVILGNGDKLPTIPDKEPNVPSVVIKPGDTPPVDVPPETPDFTWEDNPNGGITITGLTGTGVKKAQDNGQVEIPDTIGGKPVTDVNLGNIKDTITDGTTGNIDIVIPPGVADSIVGNGGNGSEMVVEKLQDKIWTYDKITEKDVSTATITGLTTYGQTAKKLVTPKSLGGVPVNKIQRVQSTNLNTMLITDNITSIGNDAFNGCTNMSGTLNIPASVVSIGRDIISGTKISTVNLDTTDKVAIEIYYGPFSGSNVTTINYTNKALTKLPDAAFKGAGKLTSYSYPASVTEIGNNAFEGCTSLTKINDLSGITKIGNYAFYGCTSLTAAPVIPNTITSIGNNAFDGCNNMTGTLNIPSSVISIGREIIRNTKISTVNLDTTDKVAMEIYYGPFSGSNVTTINYTNKALTKLPDAAFKGAEKLTSYSYPASVTEIGNNAFEYCTSLTKINDLTGITKIGNYVFNGCTGLTTPVIPTTVTSIGNYTFSGCTNMSGTLNIPASVVGMGEQIISGTKISTANLDTTNKLVMTGYYGPFKNSNVTTINYTNNALTKLPHHALAHVGKMTAYSYPASVTEIGDAAFADSPSLTKLNDLTGITKIGNDAFNGCTGLTTPVIPNTVTSIGSRAFYNCTNMTGTLNIPASVVSINEQIISRTKISTVNLNTTDKLVISGYYGPFTGSNATTINYTNKALTKLPYYAFGGAGKMTAYGFPSSVTEIGPNAFHDCSSITSVMIPANIKKIGANVFAFNTPKLSTVILMVGNDTVIDPGMWGHNSSITTVDFQNPDLTKIPANAFRGIQNLNKITVPEKITEIGSWAFASNPNLETVIGMNNVQTIRNNAFRDCPKLTAIELPASVKTIEENAFYNCSGLKTITFLGAVPAGSPWGSSAQIVTK